MLSLTIGFAFGILFSLLGILWREMEKERKTLIKDSRINLRNIR